MVSLNEIRNFKNRINPTEETEGRGSFGFYVARPVSLYVTWILLQTPIRANQVTLLHMALGILGSVLLAFPSLWVRLTGCALLYSGFVVDNVDGEIARFRREVSITGKYIDTVAHTIVNAMMFFGFGFGAYWDANNLSTIVFGFLAAFFCLRIDTFAMYAEAAKAFKSNLDKNYDYYANIEGKVDRRRGSNLEYISKRAESRLKRLVFAVFAYPGSLHVMTICLFVALLGSSLGYESSILLPAAAIAFYGTLLPIRRLFTIRQIIVRKETEIQMVELSKKKEFPE
jgi:phosphatidylglycerophosphate synthase